MMCELIAEKGSLMLDSIFISILIKIRGFRIQRERKERQREKKPSLQLIKLMFYVSFSFRRAVYYHLPIQVFHKYLF